MAITLKLLSRSPQLRLAFKALIFGVLLFWAKISGFSLIPLFIFLIAACFLYVRPIFQTFFYIYPFGILLIVGLFWLKYLPGVYSILGVGLLTALFYMMLGLKNLVFIDRERASWILNLSLFYLIFLLFFLISPVRQLAELKLAGVFLASLPLFSGILKGKRLWSWVPAFLLIESVFLISLLPIGFLQSANLAFLVAWLLSDLIFKYRLKTLSLKVVWGDLAIFTALALAIFLTSKWTLS